MTDNCKTGAEKLPAVIRQRAFNLMFSDRMMRSESVLKVLNQGLCGRLTPQLAPQADLPYLSRKDSRFSVGLKKIIFGLFALFCHK